MPDAATDQSPADFGPLAAKLRDITWKDRLVMKLLDHPVRLAAFLRFVRPIAMIGKYAVVTRYDDVMEVLGRDEDFPVPFGENFKKLDRTRENFMLGMARHDDDGKYLKIHEQVMKIFRLADLPRIAKLSAAKAEQLVAGAHGEIDCMDGLFTAVPLHVVNKYFGIPAADPDFALHLFAMQLFAFPHLKVNPAAEPAALAAARHIGPAVDRAIAAAKGAGPDDATILGRFVQAQRDGANVLTDDVIRATIVGFMLGFIPTNNRVGGQIIQGLLQNPDMLAAAEAAARSGDDDLLGRVLFEVLRFRPINPGPFRNCAKDTVLAAGTRRERTIPAAKMVWPWTFSAAFDPRRVQRPNVFDPYRGGADTMRFGWGQHWCIGYGIAITQITQTFKPLLRRGRLRRASGERGRPTYFGGYYEHQYIAYRTEETAR